MSTSQSQPGPSRSTQRAHAPPATASPLPQPIRRAVRAARPAPQAQVPPSPNPRAKSLFGSFKALTPNQRILIGLAGIAIGGAGLWADRFVLPQEEEPKPLISVRTVDRD